MRPPRLLCVLLALLLAAGVRAKPAEVADAQPRGGAAPAFAGVAGASSHGGGGGKGNHGRRYSWKERGECM